MKDYQQFLYKIENQIRNNNFIGYNPYDLMYSQYFQNFTNKKILMYLTQIYRFLPINFRSILKIKRLYSPKANGLLLSALAINGRIDISRSLIKELIDKKSLKYNAYTIGFPFPITLSWYSTPAYYPSLIITLFVIFGFIDIYMIRKEPQLLNIIESCESLINKELPKKENENFLYYSYTFDDFNEVYNATAKIGKFYAKLYKLNSRESYKEKIEKILNHLFNNQRPDGTWSYDAIRVYTDGYHTAFVLEAIWEMLSIEKNRKWEKRFEIGVDNYCKFLIKNEKQPLHYHPNYMPKDIRKFFTQTDIRDCAMAIIFLTKIGKKELAVDVLEWTMDHMYNKKKKYFYHYKDYLWKNKIEFIRPQAWMYYAISIYNKYLKV